MADAFEDLLLDIRADVIDRERDRRLLHAELDRLRAIGFGALRAPASVGGADVSFEDLVDRLIRLSAADASLGHIWRGHVAFVESLRMRGAAAPSQWWSRIVAGDFVGNAQSERNDTARLSTRIERDDDGISLTGTKYYTTGSIYADWIHLAALDDDARVAVTVSAHHDGVESVDDWAGFGQPLTGSGTTTFERVPVDEADLETSAVNPAEAKMVGSVFQLCLLAVIAGIAQRALDDTLDYVRPRRRTFGYAGEHAPREDPLVQLVLGEVSVAARSARRLVLSLARELGEAIDGGAETEVFDELQLEVFRTQNLVCQIVLDATTRLFEVGGASAVDAGVALDRHWRNVRTIASHNPIVQRTRALGMFELDGSLPEWKAPGA